MLKGFVLRTGATVYVYGTGGCSFIGLLQAPSPSCAAFQQAAVADMLVKMRPGDTVFLPSLRIPRIVDQFVVYGQASAVNEMFAPAAGVARQAGMAAALPVLKAFIAKGANVVFEAPTPEFKSPAFRCADWFDRANPICAGGSTIERTTITALRAPVMLAFANLAQEAPGVRVWDPLPVLCPSNICSNEKDGHPLFFDGDHLSGYGDALLLPDFEAFVGVEGKASSAFLQKSTKKLF
jgi:hypothetical protein